MTVKDREIMNIKQIHEEGAQEYAVFLLLTLFNNNLMSSF
jgi:hypothetical protein